MSQDNNGNENNKNNADTENKDVDVSRRNFIKNSGVAAGGVVGGIVLGGLWNPFDSKEDTKSDEDDGSELLQEARTFFSREDDFKTLAAATERIYPEDDNGPGAIELGVPYFIDKQLSGYWGFNSKDYMQGPFKPDKSGSHGLQTKMNRGEMFLAGVRKILDKSKKDHDEDFFDIEAEQQDEILEKFEAGDIDIPGMPSDIFFNLLRDTTIEGVYADPVYNGNKEMKAWKMMEYPGPRMGWSDKIDSEEFVSMDPASLREYQGGGL